tara:strand:+ start:2481 stop:2633 length:153 start_codon:yes stop_codon:yes gene_type:complete
VDKLTQIVLEELEFLKNAQLNLASEHARKLVALRISERIKMSLREDVEKF